MTWFNFSSKPKISEDNKRHIKDLESKKTELKSSYGWYLKQIESEYMDVVHAAEAAMFRRDAEEARTLMAKRQELWNVLSAVQTAYSGRLQYLEQEIKLYTTNAWIIR